MKVCLGPASPPCFKGRGLNDNNIPQIANPSCKTFGYSCSFTGTTEGFKRFPISESNQTDCFSPKR